MMYNNLVMGYGDRMSVWCVGDRVLAGSGMPAELRSTGGGDTAVVRWLDPGWQHSRVPWSTVRAMEVEK